MRKLKLLNAFIVLHDAFVKVYNTWPFAEVFKFSLDRVKKLKFSLSLLSSATFLVFYFLFALFLVEDTGELFKFKTKTRRATVTSPAKPLEISGRVSRKF